MQPMDRYMLRYVLGWHGGDRVRGEEGPVGVGGLSVNDCCRDIVVEDRREQRLIDSDVPESEHMSFYYRECQLNNTPASGSGEPMLLVQHIPLYAYSWMI